MDGAKILVKSLEDQGVKHIFGIPGNHILPVYEQLEKSKIQHILGSHEPGVGFMADGYGRINRKPGVLLLTAGPGVLNAINAIAQAYVESSPVVVIGATCDTRKWGKGCYHELEHPEVQTEILKEITKWHSRIMSPDEIPEKVQIAFHEAVSDRPRPVYLEIPENIFLMEGKYKLLDKLPLKRKKAPTYKIEQIVKDLLGAENPIIYIGGGIRSSDADKEVIELSELMGIPVVTTMMAKGVISEKFKYSLGCGAGYLGTKSALKILGESDLMLAIGTRFDEVGTGFFTLPMPPKLIHIDIDSNELSRNYQPTISVCGDAKVVLGQIIQEIKRRDYKKNTEIESKIRKLKEEEIDELKKELSGINWDDKVSPLLLIHELEKHLRSDSMLFADAGNSSMWVLGYPQTSVETIITPAGYNSMGFALPSAIAAKIAFPKRESIAILGDGSFLMTGMEFVTAVRYNIAVKVIVLHDNYYNILRFFQDILFSGKYFETQLTTFDFKSFAINCGGKGFKITKNNEIRESLNKLLKTNEPTLLDVYVDEKALPSVSQRIKTLLR